MFKQKPTRSVVVWFGDGWTLNLSFFIHYLKKNDRIKYLHLKKPIRTKVLSINNAIPFPSIHFSFSFSANELEYKSTFMLRFPVSWRRMDFISIYRTICQIVNLVCIMSRAPMPIVVNRKNIMLVMVFYGNIKSFIVNQKMHFIFHSLVLFAFFKSQRRLSWIKWTLNIIHICACIDGFGFWIKYFELMQLYPAALNSGFWSSQPRLRDKRIAMQKRMR